MSVPLRDRSAAGRDVPRRARLVRVPLAGAVAPEHAALLVRDDPRPVALVGAWAGGGALVTSAPVRVAAPGEDPFALLDAQPDVEGGGEGVGGGWFGALRHPLGALVEDVAPAPPGPAEPAAAPLAFHDHVLRLDAAGRWWFEALWTAERAPVLRERLAVLRARVAAGVAACPVRTSGWRSVPGPDGHALAVAAAVARIHAGDLFQANLALRLEGELHGAPADLFARALATLRPDRAAFLDGPGGAVVSLSPELFLERHGREVRSAPIKGTRPAGERAALEASEKDRAENVMIVDLVRNDLGRVCAPGTVRVPALARARAHAGVWHLVSEVTGRLRDGVGDGALVRAAFPPGSVTGAPKVAALDVIAELESTARGAYTGAIGFASPLAGLELSVTIRTFEADGGRIVLPVGGGVVAESDPAGEAAEAFAKARPVLEAVGATLPPVPAPVRAPAPPPRLGPRPVPRPDPARGVFTTLCAQGGAPVALAAHLARLDASVRALYARPLPGRAEALVRDAAAEVGHGRVRLDALPGPGGLRLATTTGRLPAPGGAARLVPVTVPGGLGAHKWADRRLLDALEAHAAPGLALLVDLDGLVLEAARASVLCVLGDGRLVTPPLDGRILPGTTRAQVLAHALRLGIPTAEEPLPLAALEAAPEVLVCGAVRGIEPVRAGPTTRALLSALRPCGAAPPRAPR